MKPRQRAMIALMLVFSALWIACSLPRPDVDPGGAPLTAPAPTQAGQSVERAAPSTASAVPPHALIDVKRLPLGDGRVSTQPKIGYVWSCNTSFNGGGAFASGDWMHNDGTFDLTAKPSVDGQVNWLSSFTVTLQSDKRVIVGNDLPNHSTGAYPVSPNDDAYSYDRNPNSIRAQNVRLELPAFPVEANTPFCLPMGQVGVLLTGSYFFNALDAAGKDAVAHEIQDDCQGHPEQRGLYHYHNLTKCIDDPGAGHSALLGYALDGFGMYGLRGENGEILTNADLDGCHGHTHEIEWNGQKVAMYHYHATYEYPYTIGCFQGTPLVTGNPGGGGQQPGGGGGPNGQQPPQEAIDACIGLTEGATCRINTPNGNTLNGACAQIQQQLACVPPGGPASP